jgi:hypothetical protein
MATNKTTYSNDDVVAFINAYVENEQKKSDSFQLLKLLQDWSGFEPRMWGPTIIGFGNYHYKYASGHEGDAPILGFSPEKPPSPSTSIHQPKKVPNCSTASANLPWAKPASMSKN